MRYSIVCMIALVHGALTTTTRASQDPSRSVLGNQSALPQAYRRHGKDYALLIAVDTYPNGLQKLTNPVQDARKLKSTLESTYGFQVRLLENPTRDKISDAIDDYGDSTKYHFTDDDQLLVFFAGHGYYAGDTNLGYLLAADAIQKPIVKHNPDGTDVVEQAGAARLTYYEYSEFAKSIDALPVQHELIILDACFAGNIARALHAFTRDPNEKLSLPTFTPTQKERFVARTMPLRSRIVLCSGNAAVPDGDPGRGSPFANSIRGAIEQSYQRGFLTFAELVGAVENLESGPVYAGILGHEIDGGFLFLRSESQSSARKQRGFIR